MRRQSHTTVATRKKVARVVWSPDRSAAGRCFELGGATWTIGRSVDGPGASSIVGISFAAGRMRRSVATVARARGSVLLLCATGSGKEVAARSIHDLGPNAAGPWVAVNYAAIPAEIAEAELFGYKKGA